MLPAIVIIDICGTLYASNTTMDFLECSFGSSKIYRLYRNISKTFCARVVNKLLLQVFSFDLIRCFGILFLRGKTKDEIKVMVDKFYSSFLKFRMQRESIEIVESYRKKGCRLVLVSATLDCVASKVAEELHILEYLSSELCYDKGVCLGKLSTDLLHNKRKALVKCGYLAPYEMTVSDNLSDFDLMSLSSASYIVSSCQKKKKWLKVIRDKHISNFKFLIVK
ncbi:MULTISPECIES: HAD family hydrolase [Parabacteroides]|nr:MULTISPECIES: HAD-IB family phosphatase [Parabacteroides]MDB9028310.1 HAD-IB family phosphatase [Parabacteroides distasonis]MDB9073821.1 HAD-IB family phosphatase [Parabacteroides distasonis]RKU61628.1 haloacid dehalogenase-like hydrolase [Parabacteroides sp. AF19-14]